MNFVSGMTGTLIGLEEDENARFRFEIWFDYTRQNINLVREGAMLAVPNFASNAQEQRLSILEIVTILPIHYGLGSDTSGYPGFVIEAARSAASDWESQEHEATEDTTKIKCIAIPTNLEVVQSVRPGAGAAELQEESNIPMLGHSARLLDSESTQFVVNYGIRPDENASPAGVLIRDERVSVLVRVQELLRTHFGIFGFTGAGKSNLVSTLIDRLASRGQDGLLIALGEETLPASIIEYFSLPLQVERNQRDELLNRASADLVRTALLPPALVDLRPQLDLHMRALIVRNKIRVWRERAMTIDAYIAQTRTEIKWGTGNCVAHVMRFVDGLESDFRGQGFTDANIEQILVRISGVVDSSAIDGERLTSSARNGVVEFRRRVQEDGARFANQPPIPPNLRIVIPQLVERLNDVAHSGLFIVQAHDPDELRHFAAMLGDAIYENRRVSAQISPLVSFVFDEADEFIPQGAQDTYLESSRIAMTLARRGRKFGLGLGIATQRVTYLNTSIMAQPHTYFVSKMPRKSDRERVSEAFGASEDIFRQTFKFRKGDWLLMSHDATGLDAIPVPIHTQDANARIRRALNDAQARVVERARN